MKILIIEDEYNLADVVASRLKKEKYDVDIVTDGENGLDYSLTNIYDLIILDVMLPKMNGFEVLKEIKENNINAKVIMMTAKGELDDKLNGFDNGANDYITKPFHIEELVARVNVWLKSDNPNIKKDYIEAGDIRLNQKNALLLCTKTNESIDIIGKEYFLLEYFMQNQNQVVSKEKIYEKIWGYDNESESNNLEAYISFVRKKLKAIGSNINIKAIRGLGYRLEVKVERGEKNEEARR